VKKRQKGGLNMVDFEWGQGVCVCVQVL
jgi:hypothetical protein